MSPTSVSCSVGLEFIMTGLQQPQAVLQSHAVSIGKRGVNRSSMRSSSLSVFPIFITNEKQNFPKDKAVCRGSLWTAGSRSKFLFFQYLLQMKNRTLITAQI
jgi:hypothetical protein